MIEFVRHIFGICGEHFHPNIWNTMASLPIIATTVHYIKCKCGDGSDIKKNVKIIWIIQNNFVYQIKYKT